MQTRLAMDALAQLLIKGAVNCDTHSDLQNTVNHLEIECGMCLWVIPESWASSLLWACALELPVLSAVQYVKALDEAILYTFACWAVLCNACAYHGLHVLVRLVISLM